MSKGVPTTVEGEMIASATMERGMDAPLHLI